MGKNNVYMKQWLSNKERFTDLVNGSLFEGRRIFTAENLQKEDTEQGLVIRKLNGEEITVQRYRDICMTAADGTRVVVLACENQEEVHYGMPVRGMLYDALSYVEQINGIRKERRKCKELKNSAEFLSGLKCTDLLYPVVTIVFYYGEKEWDGSQDLHGLLGIGREEYKMLKKYVPNYRINLIDPRKYSDLTCFQTDLQMVFGMLKYRKSKEKLLKYVQENKAYFSRIDEESYHALRVMLGSDQSLKSVEEKSGGINMCKALEDLYQDGINKGIEEGIEKGMAAKTVAMIRKKLGKGMELSEIADALELEPAYVQKVADFLMEDEKRTDLDVAEMVISQ